MEKRYAIFIALIVTLLIAGNYLFFYDFGSEREIVVISRAIDGDSVELEDGRKIRLLNINTPERGRKNYKEGLDFLKNLEGENVEIEVKGVDIYGRSLGKFYHLDSYVNLEIVRMGLGHKYLVENSELEDFVKVEKQAIQEEIGIWEKSEFYGCLDVQINSDEEYILIKNKCNINFDKWSIKDESTKTYVFKDINKNEFILHSEKGEDKDGEYYWGRGKIWNNDKDSIFIWDDIGLLAYYDSYGY